MVPMPAEEREADATAYVSGESFSAGYNPKSSPFQDSRWRKWVRGPHLGPLLLEMWDLGLWNYHYTYRYLSWVAWRRRLMRGVEVNARSVSGTKPKVVSDKTVGKDGKVRPIVTVIVGGKKEYSNFRKLPDLLWRNYGIDVVEHWTQPKHAHNSSIKPDLAIVLYDLTSHEMGKLAKEKAVQTVNSPTTWSALQTHLLKNGFKEFWPSVDMKRTGDKDVLAPPPEPEPFNPPVVRREVVREPTPTPSPRPLRASELDAPTKPAITRPLVSSTGVRYEIAKLMRSSEKGTEWTAKKLRDALGLSNLSGKEKQNFNNAITSLYQGGYIDRVRMEPPASGSGGMVGVYVWKSDTSTDGLRQWNDPPNEAQRKGGVKGGQARLANLRKQKEEEQREVYAAQPAPSAVLPQPEAHTLPPSLPPSLLEAVQEREQRSTGGGSLEEELKAAMAILKPLIAQHRLGFITIDIREAGGTVKATCDYEAEVVTVVRTKKSVEG